MNDLDPDPVRRKENRGALKIDGPPARPLYRDKIFAPATQVSVQKRNGGTKNARGRSFFVS